LEKLLEKLPESKISTRANIITRRTYNRPLNKEGTLFENWEQTVDRVINHQTWLWERALTHLILPNMDIGEITSDMLEWVYLNEEQTIEIEELRQVLLNRKASVAGRTLWLGGTWISRNVEISQFNCTAIEANTIYDIVDIFWCLLNGAGVGFKPVPGILTGFSKKVYSVTVIPSTRKDKGNPDNEEIWNEETKTIIYKAGDSAIAWSKFIGKLLANKYPAKHIVLDFSEIRPGGQRLKNYGWISQGYIGLANASEKIINILNKNVDNLLSAIDILDIVNLLGTVLSTRRSAQICLYDYKDDEWLQFATAKKDMFDIGNDHRTQSNNSLLFKEKPTLEELENIFKILEEGRNREPGIINYNVLKERAPFAGLMNPCAEILLPERGGGTCNLVTIDLAKFKNDNDGLWKTAKLITRANYRQTCVSLKDDILQESWNINAHFLRLCGVSLMGIAKRPDMKPYDYKRLSRICTNAANAMAKELNTPYPKNITTIKPEGTISKCFDSTEGVHTPLGKYIFNNVAFSKHDPLVEKLAESGYKVIVHPYDPSAMLVTIPVKYEGVNFSVVDGKEVNLETAVQQLDRYKMLMKNYCDQNVSCTISYSPEEIPSIIDWLYINWDNYVAVSFLHRNDPTKTAKDLGYPYLPQEVVTKQEYSDYVSTLTDFNLDEVNSEEELLNEDCATGVCPVR